MNLSPSLKATCYVVVAVSIFACGGSSSDESSEPVANNYSSVFAQQRSVVPGSVCPAGGVEIEMGFDRNENGVLDSDEITNTEAVCHGETGVSGAQGQTGVSGLDGTDGLNNLVEILDEAAGDHCDFGGIKISVGQDIDGDTVLATSEVDSVRYVCDGGQGSVIGGEPCTLVEGANDSLILQCGTDEHIVDGGVEYASFDLTSLNNGFEISDSWLASGGRSGDSFKNPHYEIEMSEAGVLTYDFLFDSSIRGYFYLYNDVGTLLVNNNGYGQVSGNANLAVGIYSLVLGTYSADEASNFTVDLLGAIASVNKLQSSRVLLEGENWASSGGRDSDSYRNRHYMFTVTTNTYINVNLDSPADDYLYLLDEAGNKIVDTSNASFLQALSPGNYRLVAATYYDYVASDFDLTVVGQFELDSFTRVLPPEYSVISGQWVRSGGQIMKSYRNNHYQFTALEDTYIDLSVSSSWGMHYALRDANENVLSSGTSRTADASYPLESGKTYDLVVGTEASLVEGASYLLRVSGHITEPALVGTFDHEITDSWVSAGGYNAPLAGGNRSHSIVVTETTTLDIVFETAVGNWTGVYLLDDIGVTVRYDYGSSQMQRVVAYDVPPGAYSVVATASTGISGAYRIDINARTGTVSIP